MSWVYFIRAGQSGPIKIGVSCDPIKRLAALQTANPERLVLLGAWRDDKDPYGLERKLHEIFAPHRIGETEWFKASRELVLLAECCGATRCDCCQGVVTSAPRLVDLGDGGCFHCTIREGAAA